MSKYRGVGTIVGIVVTTSLASLSSPITGCPVIILPTVKPDFLKTSGAHTITLVASTPAAPSGPGKALATVPTAVHSPTLTGHLITPLSMSKGTKGLVVKIGLLVPATSTAGVVPTLSSSGAT